MFRLVCFIACISATQGFASKVIAASLDDDIRDAASTLARVDFCDIGISRSLRASLTKRMNSRGAQIDGPTIYDDTKSALTGQPHSTQDNVCAETQEKFETN